MSGAYSFTKYAFMAWCSVKSAGTTEQFQRGQDEVEVKITA